MGSVVVGSATGYAMGSFVAASVDDDIPQVNCILGGVVAGSTGILATVIYWGVEDYYLSDTGIFEITDQNS